jgi:hypothetical protein
MKAGKRLLQSLFFETHRGGPNGPYYTLKDDDHNGLPSLYKLYMAANDPTEITFAETHLTGHEHWMMLCECSWFEPYATRWRKELELKIKGKALRVLQEMADEGGPQALQAAKALLDYDKFLDKKDKKRVGRPNKVKEVLTPSFDLQDIYKNIIPN